MDSIDFIIIVIFLIIVGSIVNQAIVTVERQTEIELQKQELEQQLSEKTLEGTPLKDLLNITFRIEPSRYQFNYYEKDKDAQPKSFIMTVINKSEHVNIYIDWDKSSISNYTNLSRRLIRLKMDEKLNVNSLPPGSQVSSPVTPGNTMTSRITAEDVLELKTDDKTGEKFLQPKDPILSLYGLQFDIKNKKLPKPVREGRKKLKKDFDYRQKPLMIVLRLMLRLVDLNQGSTREYQYLLLCRFTVSRVLWTDRLPWMPKKA